MGNRQKRSSARTWCRVAGRPASAPRLTRHSIWLTSAGIKASQH